MRTNSFPAGLAGHARTIITARHLLFRRCLWTGLLAFAKIAFGPRWAQAAVTEAWVQRYCNVQSNATAQAVKVVRHATGDILVTGGIGRPGTVNRDMLTIMYSGADGSVLWQQGYKSPFDDRPRPLALDGSGNPTNHQ